MYMKKQSLLTPFIAHGIRKMAESGITNLHSKRHVSSKPNCKPVRSKGRPLGLEKFASLFTFYIIGCIVSLIILVIENIHKAFSSKKKSQGMPPMPSHKKEELIRKIYAFEEDIMSLLDNNEDNNEDNILLTAQQIKRIYMLLKRRRKETKSSILEQNLDF